MCKATQQNDTQALVNAWLAKGNTIKVLPAGFANGYVPARLTRKAIRAAIKAKG